MIRDLSYFDDQMPIECKRVPQLPRLFQVFYFIYFDITDEIAIRSRSHC